MIETYPTQCLLRAGPASRCEANFTHSPRHTRQGEGNYGRQTNAGEKNCRQLFITMRYAGLIGYGERIPGPMARLGSPTVKTSGRQDKLAIERHLNMISRCIIHAHIRTISGIDIALWDLEARYRTAISVLMGGRFALPSTV